MSGASFEEAFRRASATPLREPPPMPEGAGHDERERHAVMWLAFEMAKRLHARADRLLSGGAAEPGAEC